MRARAPLAVAILTALAIPPAAGADGLPVPGIDAKPISAPKSKLAYVTRGAGRRTSLEEVDGGSGRRLRRVVLRGRLSVPAIAYDATPSGLTPDGRTLVLINPRRTFPRRQTDFAVIDTRTMRIRSRLRLRGDYSFDALSPDGRIMYVIRYPEPRNFLRYEVRAYDLRARRLLRDPCRRSAGAGGAHEWAAGHPGHQRRWALGAHALRRGRIRFHPRPRHPGARGVLHRP